MLTVHLAYKFRDKYFRISWQFLKFCNSELNSSGLKFSELNSSISDTCSIESIHDTTQKKRPSRRNFPTPMHTVC